MKFNLLFALLFILSFISCKTDNKDVYTKSNDVETVNNEENDLAVYNSKGYELMKQKCFICHFERPDPSRRDKMLAPPFLRVQEHYKPSYPQKEEFINAIAAIVNNPSKKNTLMPGAIKKFNLMPKLVYNQAELRLIAEALYDIDYGSSPKMRMNQDLQLNNGKKWKLSPKSMGQINTILKNLEYFRSDDIARYNQFGKLLFAEAKEIMLDDSYTGEKWKQIHNFFGDIEGSMHILIATKSIDEANNQITVLKLKFKEFTNYFE